MVSFLTRILEFHFPYVINTIYFFSNTKFPFWGHTTQLVEFYLPFLGLNLGLSNESMDSQPLDCQGIPSNNYFNIAILCFK